MTHNWYPVKVSSPKIATRALCMRCGTERVRFADATLLWYVPVRNQPRRVERQEPECHA